MPNFKKLAKNYYKVALSALQEDIRIPSVYDATTIKEGAPYGTGVKKALDYLAKLGRDYGFKVDTCDGYCTELTIGEEGPLIGVYGHSDVVPATGKWENSPWSPAVKDGKMVCRGCADDKGPLIASLYAIKSLKDNGLIKGYRVRLVSGGDEERGSSCLDYYFHHLHKEQCDYGFTPDADWPLIYGEKAIRRATLFYEGKLGPVIEMMGGEVANAVCDKILVTLPRDKKFEEYLKKNEINADVSSNEVLTMVTFKGKAAHGSTPELGINAALIAFKTIGEFYKVDALTKIYNAIKDSDGASFSGKVISPELGAATYNYGVVRYSANKLTISLDFRFGETCNPDDCLKALGEKSGLNVEVTSVTDALLFDKKDPLITTLMKAYKKETFDLFAKPFTIGGGTYAKEAKNIVAFGAAFKKHPGDMHAPTEYLYLDDFYKDIAIYARAIYMLGNLKK